MTLVHPTPSQGKHQGFTLIELLVVIAIIAILAAILFPVFAKAREKARQTQCLNNQKQIATAVMIFTQENEETFPTAQEFWSSIDVPAKVLKCPTAGKNVTNAYVYSKFLDGVGMGEVYDPVSELVTADGQHKATTSPDTVANIAYKASDFALRHNKLLMASFADGHVEARTQPTWKFTAYAWYDAASLADTTADGTRVSQWQDLSPNNHTAQAPADWSRPTFSAGGMSGRPALKFDGVMNFLACPVPPHIGAVVVAGMRLNEDDWHTMVMAFTSVQDGSGNCGMVLRFTPRNYSYSSKTEYGVGVVSSFDRYLHGDTSVSTNTPFVVAGTCDTIASDVYFNGTKDATPFAITGDTRPTDGISDSNGVKIGSIGANYWGSGASGYFPGYISAVLLFDHPLDRADIDGVQQALKAEYGVK